MRTHAILHILEKANEILKPKPYPIAVYAVRALRRLREGKPLPGDMSQQDVVRVFDALGKKDTWELERLSKELWEKYSLTRETI